MMFSSWGQRQEKTKFTSGSYLISSLSFYKMKLLIYNWMNRSEGLGLCSVPMLLPNCQFHVFVIRTGRRQI